MERTNLILAISSASVLVLTLAVAVILPSFWSGLLLGVLILFLSEILAVAYLWVRIKTSLTKLRPDTSTVGFTEKAFEFETTADQRVAQGYVWICTALPGEEDSPSPFMDSVPPSKQKARPGAVELPELRLARLDGRILTLRDKSGREDFILLSGCQVKVISGTSGQERKWSRKFPTRIHNPQFSIYRSSNRFFLYFPTGPLKEAWTILLREAACPTDDQLSSRSSRSDESTKEPSKSWYRDLRRDYREYMVRVSSQYQFWHDKKVLEGDWWMGDGSEVEKVKKVTSEQVVEKLSWFRKISNKKLPEKLQDNAGAGSSSGRTRARLRKLFDRKPSPKITSIPKVPSSGSISLLAEESRDVGDISGREEVEPRLDSIKVDPGTPQEPPEVETGPDSGTQWVNALVARLFFDMSRNRGLHKILQAKIQKKMEQVRRPSYMGPLICSHFDLGNAPPLASRLQALPIGPGGAVSLELDLEYYGGSRLTVETRLDMRESGWSKGGETDPTDEDPIDSREDRPRQVPPSRIMSGLRAVVNNMAEQVSLVPLTLSLEIRSIRGLAHVRLGPPPTNVLWFGFVHPPEVEIVPLPSVGGINITNNPVATWIVEKIRAVLTEAIVLPQSSDVQLTFMERDGGDTADGEDPPVPWGAPNSDAQQNPFSPFHFSNAAVDLLVRTATSSTHHQVSSGERSWWESPATSSTAEEPPPQVDLLVNRVMMTSPSSAASLMSAVLSSSSLVGPVSGEAAPPGPVAPPLPASASLVAPLSPKSAHVPLPAVDDDVAQVGFDTGSQQGDDKELFLGKGSIGELAGAGDSSGSPDRHVANLEAEKVEAMVEGEELREEGAAVELEVKDLGKEKKVGRRARIIDLGKKMIDKLKEKERAFVLEHKARKALDFLQRDKDGRHSKD